ncbi:MAG TPA: ChbG/HpnK family deacetylase [Terriglobales bacterium]|nr:ChbG/HpnK family deacetylase [Terriglobales bacterium]
MSGDGASLAKRGSIERPARESRQSRHTGFLIVNADDWGLDRETTDRTLECISQRTVSSVSAMVFMEDSERAAAIAGERRIDAGLHLNFTTLFSASRASSALLEHQRRISGYLRNRFAQVIFHPGLAQSFRYVAAAQRDEFHRLYGAEPCRYDGHHHMHLCANVLWQGLLPARTQVRRNFSFQAGEKGLMNCLYRRAIDRILARHHFLTDFFFALPSLDCPGRLDRICSLARTFTVELAAHPVRPEEYRLLTEGEVLRRAPGSPIAAGFTAARGSVKPAV